MTPTAALEGLGAVKPPRVPAPRVDIGGLWALWLLPGIGEGRGVKPVLSRSAARVTRLRR